MKFTWKVSFKKIYQLNVILIHKLLIRLGSCLRVLTPWIFQWLHWNEIFIIICLKIQMRKQWIGAWLLPNRNRWSWCIIHPCTLICLSFLDWKICDNQLWFSHFRNWVLRGLILWNLVVPKNLRNKESINLYNESFWISTIGYDWSGKQNLSSKFAF